MELKADISRTLRDGGGRTALEFKGRSVPWGHLASLAETLDVALSTAGFGDGVVVGVLGRNDPLCAGAFVTTLATGRCAAPINPFQPVERMVADAHKAGVAVLILAEPDTDDPVWRDFGGLVISLTDAGSVRILRDGGHRPASRRSALLVATSGTTGTPKRIAIEYPTLAQALKEIAGFHLGFGDLDGLGATLPPLIQYSPLAHIGGVLTLARGAESGRGVVLLEKFNPTEWVDVVRRHRQRITGLPPAMMRMVLNQSPDAEDLQSLASVWSGSAPADLSVEGAFTEHYGVPVLGNYGATEFCGAVATWSLEDYRLRRAEKLGAVGRIWPHVAKARVRDQTTDAILPAGESGALELQVHRVGKRWLSTTDLAHVDPDGFLFLHGRADQAINRGGFKILPEVVASAARKHPAILDAAVVGIADSRLGQAPAAAVEVRRGEPRPGAAEIIAFIKNQLPAYYAPIAVAVLDELPRTPSMKIDQQAIKALFVTGELDREASVSDKKE
jgi:acyl-CoA synthetase (AMP-forming)/AMP-acid ligase II